MIFLFAASFSLSWEHAKYRLTTPYGPCHLIHLWWSTTHLSHHQFPWPSIQFTYLRVFSHVYPKQGAIVPKTWSIVRTRSYLNGPPPVSLISKLPPLLSLVECLRLHFVRRKTQWKLHARVSIIRSSPTPMATWPFVQLRERSIDFTRTHCAQAQAYSTPYSAYHNLKHVTHLLIIIIWHRVTPSYTPIF